MTAVEVEIVNTAAAPFCASDSYSYQRQTHQRWDRPDGEYEWRWKEVAVSEAIGASPNDIRCVHCHGRVRIHQQQVAHGPQDHVEHLSRQDSENCMGGHHFKGQHRLSSEPVQ
jgi:hypothetical protein